MLFLLVPKESKTLEKRPVAAAAAAGRGQHQKDRPTKGRRVNLCPRDNN